MIGIHCFLELYFPAADWVANEHRTGGSGPGNLFWGGCGDRWGCCYRFVDQGNEVDRGLPSIADSSFKHAGESPGCARPWLATRKLINVIVAPRVSGEWARLPLKLQVRRFLLRSF